MAYSNGDSAYAIRHHLSIDKVAFEKFASSRNNDVSGEDGSRKILGYILERYANMRGTHFVKHIKGTGNSIICKVVDAQSTRARVTNSIAIFDP